MHGKLRVQISARDHLGGPLNAPIVLLEYGDFECPYSGEFAFTVKRLQETFKDNLCFVFRHFPLTQIHPNALNAACAAEAADRQGRGKFWEMHDLLFENQENLDMKSLFEYGMALSLVLEDFSSDMESSNVEERIMEDIESGSRSGVNGTPTLFINGVRYEGDRSYEALAYLLKGLLTKAA